MREGWKVRTADECDAAVRAEFPNHLEEPKLHNAITSYMIHRQCGPVEPHSPCMQGVSCSKRSPKPLRQTTSMEEDGYPLYKRRNLFPTEIPDEISQQLNTRYVSAPQSIYRVFGFPLQDKSHTVYRLAVHLPEFQTVYFVEGRERDSLMSWDEFAHSMSDDYIHQGVDQERAISLAYFDVLDRTSLLGKDLAQIVSPPTRERPPPVAIPIDYDTHERNGVRQYDTLNAMQKEAADSILSSLDGNGSRYIFVDGPGGRGKTYLYNTVYNIAVALLRDIMQNNIPFGGKAGQHRCLKHGPTQPNVLKPHVSQDRIISGSYERSSRRKHLEIIPFGNRTILAPKNVHVQPLNEDSLDRLQVDNPGDERHYKSVDEAIYSEGQTGLLFLM
ncbi:hypothetical protein COOONC_01836 [Cooperia oncophora]